MTTRTAVLDYRTSGAEQAQSKVVSLAQALEAQKRRADEAAPALQRATLSANLLGSVSQSATAKISSLTNTIGPLGAGVGALARSAPAAAQGLISLAASAERASLFQRTLNVALIGGAATMTAGSVAALAYADDVLRAGDSYAVLQARIRTFADSSAEAARTEEALFQMARSSRGAVADLTTLYVRLAPAMKDIGREQADALKITDLTSKALAIQGAEVRERSAATLQFSQAIASGVLRGDELRSLLESSPQLMRFIAEGLGVQFSALREMGEKGALTADKIIPALLKMEGQINKTFSTAPKTAAQGWQTLNDQVMRTVGSISAATGLTEGAYKFLADLAARADDFRIDTLADPKSMSAIKDTAEFLGDAVALIGSAGAVAVENFDLLVGLGQAVIALKIGDVVASGFVLAAERVRSFRGDFDGFVQASRFHAGAALDSTGAAAALSLRREADAAAVRSAELVAQAEMKAARAIAARRAAEEASLQASLARSTVGAGSAVALEAEAAATNLNAAATRMETQAEAASVAAKNASTAASTRAAVATQAEAAVTTQATGAMWAKGVAMRGLIGLYTALGGAVGVATLGIVAALGLMVHAQMEAERTARDLKAGLDLAAKMTEEAADAAGQLATAQDTAAAATDRAASASRRHAAALADERKEILLAARAAAAKNVTMATERVAMARAAGQAADMKVIKQAERDLEVAKNQEGYIDKKYLELATKGSGQGRRGGSGTAQGPGSAGGYIPPGKPSDPPDAGGKTKRAPKTTVPAPVNNALDDLIRQRFLPKEGLDRFTLKGDEILDAKSGGAFAARSEDEAKAAAEYVKQIEAINSATDKQIEKTGESREALRQAASAKLAYAVSTSQASQAEDRWADILAETAGENRAVIKAEAEVQALRDKGASITDQAAKDYLAFVAAREAAKRASAARSFVDPIASEAFGTITAGQRTLTTARGSVDPVAMAKAYAAQREAILAESERRIREESARTAQADGLSKIEAEKRLNERLAQNRLAVEKVLQDQILDLTRQRIEQEGQLREEEIADLTATLEGGFKEALFGGDWSEIGRKIGMDILDGLYEEFIGNPLRQLISDALRGSTDGDTSTGLFQSLGRGITGSGQTGANNSNVQAINALGAAATQAASGLGDNLVDATAKQVVQAATGAAADQTQAGASAQVTVALTALSAAATAAAGALAAVAASSAAEGAGNLTSTAVSAFAGAMAGGGRVSGPGTGTSDDILTFLSDGEFVTKASATKRWLPLLETINRGGNPLAYLLAQAPRLAAGGLAGGAGISAMAQRAWRDESPYSTSSGMGSGAAAMLDFQRTEAAWSAGRSAGVPSVTLNAPINAQGSDPARLRRVEEGVDQLARDLPGLVVDVVNHMKKAGAL